MRISNEAHLTYCSNIHPGESWSEVYEALQIHLPVIKQQVSPDKPMGIGLRLSNTASLQLQKEGTAGFINWMKAHDFYVFTMNGFPYGGFHRQRVKDQVHQPDWTTSDRLEYTLRLFDQLAELIPDQLDGGISTSPLSYKHWWAEDQLGQVFQQATDHLVQVVKHLNGIYQNKGILLHLDIEPEPDGLLENTKETIDYFNRWLLPAAARQLSADSGTTVEEARKITLRHITVCYDVCHFAVAFENHSQALEQLREHGIQIGKIQISSALKTDFSTHSASRDLIEQAYQSLNEPTYLHQVVARKQDGSMQQYPDLPQALDHIEDPEFQEWRTHFHVPVFVETYGLMDSTRKDIEQVLDLWKQSPMSTHLEVETYTWEVLPEELQSEINTSISRELKWVLKHLEQ